MKFRGLEIKKETFGDNKGKFAGRINFESNNKDTIYLTIDAEYAKKFIEVALPLFEIATSEKIEIIRDELGLNE